MLIHKFSNYDEAHQEMNSIIIKFAGNRRVLSTSNLNGGLHDDLYYVFNNDCKPQGREEIKLLAPTYKEHIRETAKNIGLDPKKSTGLCTAAYIKNKSIKVRIFEDFSVTAIVTAGINHNAGRVGEEAHWHEYNEEFLPVNFGTINIMLHIDANLTKGAITRALVTCTEAKTAALQELLAPSLSSDGIATGTGTDGTIIVTDLESKKKITETGKHVKIGEYIGITVKEAVKEALSYETGLEPKSQYGVMARMQRFGLTEDSLWSMYNTIELQCMDRITFTNLLYDIESMDKLIVNTSLFAHLIDQINWGLIPISEGYKVCVELLRSMDFYVEDANPSTISVKKIIDLFKVGLVTKIIT